MLNTSTNYDKYPSIKINDPAEHGSGWKNVCALIKEKVDRIPGKPVVAIDCYHGVFEEEVKKHLQEYLPGTFYSTKEYMLNEEQVQQLVYPDVTDDEVFGYLTRLKLDQFFDYSKVSALQKQISRQQEPVIYLFGVGASLLCPNPDLIIYFDMPRWEIQLRFRRNEIGNLGLNNKTQKTSLQYKQAFFVDWRVCDRHKKTVMNKWDFVIDSTLPGNPKIVSGSSLNKALKETVSRPFRLVPFFDPGPWGGQWLKTVCGLDPNEKNFAWGFDCVPEENSLLFQFGEMTFETPAINLVFAESKRLLGEAVQGRFGDEFPIRFDFLDTMAGGNLSLQVHPTTEYAQENFGIRYTQDESYYILDAKEDAFVYLGLEENISPAGMIRDLREANQNGSHFEAEKYAKKWAIKKHDHILIPAGTVHCSGKNSMVLEISATPYIFTFKLWDWGRMGLDGKPRPINIEHGKKVIDWTFTPERTKRELKDICETLSSGDGWKEERTGLHEREFIETRRHWFTKSVTHHTGGSVNVLNLIEGREAIVESPSNHFEPFIVHYAETFVIPANVKEYRIRPHGESEGQSCATIKAFVRINP
jgi:mannose-6-phosphate isomerase class I